MKSLNVVCLSGGLTKDGELKYTAGGTPVLSFSIAVTKTKKSGDSWEDYPCYFNCVMWGKLAEALAIKMTKGTQVAITGELDQQRWQDQATGQGREKVVVQISNIRLIPSAAVQSTTYAQKSQNNTGFRGNPGSFQGGQRQQPPSQGNFFSTPPTEEDYAQFDDDGIPF